MSENDSKTPVGNVLLATMTDMAITLARRENLLAEDGQIRCWNCKRLGALMPSLHCRGCLEVHRDRTKREREAERCMHPETHRWRALIRNMTEDSRLDRELAEKLLKRASELPSATAQRREALQAAFDARFGPAQAAAPRWPRRQFRRAVSEDDFDDR